MNEKVENKKKRKKRKISIITVFLWIFLVLTMVTITLGNTKNTQALESNGISLELEMYDQTSDTPNEKVDKIVWEKEGYESGIVLLKVKINGYANRDYESGELELKLLSNGNEVNNDYYKINLDNFDSWNCKTNWGYDDSQSIKNAYKIKKGQKISDVIEISNVYKNIKGNGSDILEVVIYENNIEVLKSNKCNLEYNFKVFEDVSYEKNTDTFFEMNDLDAHNNIYYLRDSNVLFCVYNINVNKEIEDNMKLKLYYIIPKEIDFDNELFKDSLSLSLQGWDYDIEEEIISNTEYNITENYNEKKDTKIEVIIDLEALKNSNFIGVIELYAYLEYTTNIDNAQKREIYNIKNYAMWEQQELYAYDNSDGSGIGIIGKDIEDIDNDGNFDEILIHEDVIVSFPLKKQISVETIYDVLDKTNIPESETIKVKTNGELIREFNITKKHDGNHLGESYFYNIIVDIYDENGEKIEYTIEEEKKDGYLTYIEYSKSSYNEFEEQYNVYYIKENEIDQITTEFNGEKYWDDNSNEFENRPSSIMMQLKDGENVVKEVELKKDDYNNLNNWRYKFTGIKKYKKNENNAELIKYTIDEKETDSSYIKEINKAGNVITNIDVNKISTITTDLLVKKIWEDDNNRFGKRLDSVTIQLKDGEDMVSEAVVNEENNWQYTFSGVRKYRDNGSIIVYNIDEKETSEFYEKELLGDRIINRFVVPDTKIKIVGNKIWEDNENKAGKRADSVILQIKVGENVISEAEVNESNNWSYEFDVPKYDEAGNEIEYTVDEKETNEFYEKIIDGYTVINKYKNVVGDEDKDYNDENIENGVVDVDTSDINIFAYVVIFFVAIIGIAVGIIFVRKNRTRKK